MLLFQKQSTSFKMSQSVQKALMDLTVSRNAARPVETNGNVTGKQAIVIVDVRRSGLGKCATIVNIKHLFLNCFSIYLYITNRYI